MKKRYVINPGFLKPKGLISTSIQTIISDFPSRFPFT